MIEVIHNPLGWWDVRDQDGRVAARYVSEFQAWEAGRALAEQCGADLRLHPERGPAKYEVFDSITRTVRPTARTPAKSRGTAARRLVLVVEDASDARDMYAEYLKYAGLSVATAVNGHEAVRMARLLRPDLILMDMRLPGMDGIEATAELKLDPSFARVPIVAITADASDEICERARRAGCTAFIAKPALPQHVASYVIRLLHSEAAQT